MTKMYQMYQHKKINSVELNFLRLFLQGFVSDRLRGHIKQRSHTLIESISKCLETFGQFLKLAHFFEIFSFKYYVLTQTVKKLWDLIMFPSYLLNLSSFYKSVAKYCGV